MSLNLGGLYVVSERGVTRAKVVAAIKAFWTEIGARPHTGDVLAIDPLSLEKTGVLGFAVGRETDGWIAVYDSERYRADPALARYLNAELGVPVLHFEFHGATDGAYAKVYGSGGPKLSAKPKWEEIEALVDPMPFAFLYFNKLRK